MWGSCVSQRWLPMDSCARNLPSDHSAHSPSILLRPLNISTPQPLTVLHTVFGCLWLSFHSSAFFRLSPTKIGIREFWQRPRINPNRDSPVYGKQVALLTLNFLWLLYLFYFLFLFFNTPYIFGRGSRSWCSSLIPFLKVVPTSLVVATFGLSTDANQTS